jgi:hypothetical protein
MEFLERTLSKTSLQTMGNFSFKINGCRTGPIIGAVVGVLVALIVLGVIIAVIVVRRRRNQNMKRTDSTIPLQPVAIAPSKESLGTFEKVTKIGQYYSDLCRCWLQNPSNL